VSLSGAAVAYSVVGGLVLYSGIKGATIADTASAVLTGNLTVSNTEPIDVTNSTPASSTTPGGGSTPVTAAAGPATAGGQLQNGTTIYKYLRANGYTPMMAAGAVASMWGESSLNPESQGTGGRGLIGWTPASSLPDSAYTGNAANDMSAQLPLILQFVSANGDESYVQMMAGASTVTAAAQIWDQHVERAGIDDVHSEGVSLAVQIAKSVDNVALAAS
jgi:Phage tail lysozyme